MENHLKEQEKLEEVIDYLETFDETRRVKFNIRYIMDVFDIYGNELFEEKNKKLYQTIIKILKRVELSLSKNRNYVEISVQDALVMLKETLTLGLDKSMVVITRRLNK